MLCSKAPRVRETWRLRQVRAARFADVDALLYALAASHWQQLVTDGHAKLVVMEALKCPLPSLNNGEDNAVFKSLLGTLLKCPGPGHCADPLFCRAGFFQVTVPESSTQTTTSELLDWIDHDRFTPYRSPLGISRKTHENNAPSTFSCRLQWKARRERLRFSPNRQSVSQREFQC